MVSYLHKECINVIEIDIGRMTNTKADEYLKKVADSMRKYAGKEYKIVTIAKRAE